MKCHNIFTLDENRDEPTFTNDKGKFFLLDILKKEERNYLYTRRF